ncbi:MAG: blaR1 peptidase family protein [Gemmatimonadetes bacterium]|nr:blaR1 peptidase family protein [Gemmatimonadota bacterium]
MIAAWMLYCALCALGLSVGAVLAERALLAGRAPVRLVWIVAVALSLIVPAVAFRFAPRAVAADRTAAVAAGTVPDQSLENAAAAPAPIVGTPHASSPARDWRTTLARSDAPLAIVWIALSLAVALNFFAGIAALHWMRRGWERRTVLDVAVFVSDRTGPAVVGAVSPVIVLPEWTLALEPEQLTLMLRHEQEHQRAGDGQLLAVAQLALIVMPWNLALWWQVVRLRVAVEMDCDARVLRDANARSYGDLLLEVARPRRGPRLMGATAFAERATQLERRIRVLGRHRTGTPRVARVAAACVGILALTAARLAPHPAVPSRAAAPFATFAARVPALPVQVETQAEPQVDTAVPKPIAMQPRAEAPLQPATVRCDGSGSGQDSALVATVFRQLFDGVSLTIGQRASACDILVALAREQVAEDSAAAVTVPLSQGGRALIQARRNLSMRALLTNDADRATLDARLAQTPGGRGRSGGPLPDALGGGRRGRGALFDTLVVVAGGGRSASLPSDPPVARSLNSLTTMMGRQIAGITFDRLFEGIALTPDQDALAHDLIDRAQQQTQALLPPRPVVRLRVNPVTGMVTVRASDDAALLALLSNDADRATLRSRIMRIPE